MPTSFGALRDGIEVAAGVGPEVGWAAGAAVGLPAVGEARAGISLPRLPLV